MKYNCIIILGPTASGKTKLSVELAKTLNGEIVNADSQQIIKGLNVGTAKVTEEEKENIPHHLFDIVKVGENFSVSEYSQLALAKIEEINDRGKIAVIVGGTGFYINSLLYNYTFGNANKDEKLRAHYEDLALIHGKEYVYNILKELDPKSATTIEQNDLKRVIRAIEIAKTSTTKKSEQVLTKNPNISPIIIGLDVNRELLYDRINRRVDIMMNDGLETEIFELKDKGFFNNDIKYQLPIGYSEWKEYFDGTISREDVLEKIKQDTRHYAKRQITWFKRVEGVKWYKMADPKVDIPKIVEDVKNIITNA